MPLSARVLHPNSDELQAKNLELQTALKKLEICYRDNAALRKKLEVPSSDRILELEGQLANRDKSILSLQSEVKNLKRLIQAGEKTAEKKKSGAEIAVIALEKQVIQLKEQLKTFISPPSESAPYKKI